MKIQTYPGNWAAAATWTPPGPAPGACPYVGIAIGPQSDEGAIFVNDVLLQAGRVLALPASAAGYRVTRAHAAGQFTSLSRLDVMLFEHQAELGAAVHRANLAYASVAGGVNVVTEAAFTDVLRIPFHGRRQARIVVRGTTSMLSTVRVVGTYWSEARGALQTKWLEEVAMEVDDDDTVAEAAIYVGGTNEAEAWTELVASVQLAAAGAEVYYADALAIGELV